MRQAATGSYDWQLGRWGDAVFSTGLVDLEPTEGTGVQNFDWALGFSQRCLETTDMTEAGMLVEVAAGLTENYGIPAEHAPYIAETALNACLDNRPLAQIALALRG
jgi:hypothetical protein